MTRRASSILTLAAILALGATGEAQPKAGGRYQDLVAMFAEWSAFERPPLLDGAPDYSATTTARRHEALKTYLTRRH
jgi:hypothetical protein